MTPKLSVTVTTYEHRPWLRQCLESVLAQQAPFPCEVIVGEDCSTDGTRELLLEIAAEHPGRLELVLPERNLGRGGNALYKEVLARARGEYVAPLDGDDYWTATDKLARQVALLDADPTLALCFHDARVLEPAGWCPSNYTAAGHPARSGLRHLLRDNFIASCSPVIRRRALPDLPEWYVDLRFGDWILYILAARHGDVAYIPEPLGVYRATGRGAWAGLSRRDQLRGRVEFLKDVGRRLGLRTNPHYLLGLTAARLKLLRA